ncbi:hypothetical protein FNQ90_03025 [Streptomyces alkaliphilus]|uniref:Uncharacterized protein n=1 Tax=Streptomyces alkaliphilus TaxID=1472722 RepID=A0A7W3TA58_9ACTN|nr:hypothetical protein [Streptomyces alkaliphilus]MBB0243108.1 hypothetical protein [Streptomyces alkaliphilus]
MTTGPETVEFDETQIGRGLKPVAQHGRVVVANGVVELYGDGGEPVDRAPAGAVVAKPMAVTFGQNLALTMNGTRWNVSPGWGRHVGRPSAMWAMFGIRRQVKALHAAIEAHAGRTPAG